jgi:hypothetical protein
MVFALSFEDEELREKGETRGVIFLKQEDEEGLLELEGVLEEKYFQK